MSVEYSVEGSHVVVVATELARHDEEAVVRARHLLAALLTGPGAVSEELAAIGLRAEVARRSAPVVRPGARVPRGGDVRAVLGRAEDTARRAGRRVAAADIATALLTGPSVSREALVARTGFEEAVMVGALQRALERELAEPALEPTRLWVTAEAALSVMAVGEGELREAAAAVLVRGGADERFAAMLSELLADELEVRSVAMAVLRAGPPEESPEPRVTRREGTAWIHESSEWVPVGAEEAEYLTGTFSAHWSGTDGAHEPGPTGGSLEDVLGWGRWRAPRVVVAIPDRGRFSAGDVGVEDTEPWPPGDVDLLRRPSPSSEHLFRSDDDEPILWQVRFTAPRIGGVEPSTHEAMVRAFAAALLEAPDVLEPVTWDGPHPTTGYAANLLVRHATYAQASAHADRLVHAAFAAVKDRYITGAGLGRSGVIGPASELYPYDGNEAFHRDPTHHGRVW